MIKALIYSLVQDDKGYTYSRIEVYYTKNGIISKCSLEQYLKEEMDDSLHELIRGNVLLATRYFNQRVKKFFSKIVMGKNNPMNVEHYTYKVEFQERGAGHIHGTLWLDLNKLEEMIRSNDGEIMQPSEDTKSNSYYEDENHDNNERYPFKGINSAFRKLKNNGNLNSIEKKALENFVDEFTTVSTNANKVGRDVAKIAKEVNRHAHTKSCRKYDGECRFNFPKYPSVRTIIATPLCGLGENEKNDMLKNQREILKKVGNVLTDDDIVKEVIETIGDSEEESMAT